MRFHSHRKHTSPTKRNPFTPQDFPLPFTIATTQPTDQDPDHEDLTVIASFDSRNAAEEIGLVVVAMRMPCWLLKSDKTSPQNYKVAVLPEDADNARAEHRAYLTDLQDPATEPGRQLPTFSTGRWLAFSYALILVLCYIQQGREPGFEERNISNNHAIIEDGQFHRAATALLLHADEFHLLGNIIFGAGFGLLVASSIGPITGWALIVASGIVGNFINAHHYYPDLHRSLGASTAVFGALGILTGYGLIAAFLSPKSAPWARAILPIAGGFALLGWFGLGGPEVDVMAHVYGFACGIPLGFLAGWFRILSQSSDPTRAENKI